MEFKKRFAGSLFGSFWIVLQPVLFLAIYLFVYLFVFRVRFPGYGQLDYVVFVFSGLVPYIAFMETLGMATASIKRDIHLVRNVMLPVDLVPARVVLMTIVTEFVGLAMIVGLSVLNGTISANLLFLPLALLLQVLFLLGLSTAFSAMGVFVPDLNYFVNLMVLLLLFVSPIAFRPDMVPEGMRFVVDFNPIYYMAEIFRFSLIDGYEMPPRIWIVAVVGSLVFYVLGCIFFRRFRKVLVDYE
ncbi:MAG: ABC transporter permease [Rhodospirillales bacterium]|nr:ABC transporter permease [Rhodospirillales bacterium]